MRGNVDRAEALMIAKWPEPADYAKYVDEDAERAFELCRAVVSAARATRSRYRLSPKAELDVVVRAGAEDIEKLESLRSTIEPLANTASLAMVPTSRSRLRALPWSTAASRLCGA